MWKKYHSPHRYDQHSGSRRNDSGGGAGDSCNSCANKDGSEGGECGSNTNVLAKHWFSTCFFIPLRLNILFSYFYHYYTYEKFPMMQ